MKRTFRVLLVLMVVLSMLPSFALATDVSSLPQVELRVFAIADAPKNAELAAKFYEELNKVLTEKLHCTVKYDYAAGNDYQNNYQLVMAAGEKYDLIHSASWLNYATNARKGAFLELDELLPKYAPYIWSQVTEDRWSDVKVNGKIYGVPSTYVEWSETSLFYRLDLCEKYGLEKPVDFKTIEAYLQAIKDNEPEMLPSDDYQSQAYGTMFIPSTKYMIVDKMNDRHSNFVIDPKNPRKVLSTIELPEYKEFMVMMKDWADRGFWPRSVLSSLEWGVFSVLSGKAAMSFNGQFNNYGWMVPENEKTHPGWKLDYHTHALMNEESAMVAPSATGNMLSITRNADNPERALMLIDLIHQDQKLYDLVRYGLEGTNYKLSEDGAVDTSFVDLSIDGYNYFSGALFGDKLLERKKTSDWSETEERMKVLESRAITNVLGGFVFDTSNIEAEYTALNQVRIEYAFPLQAGLVEDVDAAYQTLLEKSKDAGLEACRVEVERLVNEFLDAKGVA